MRLTTRVDRARGFVHEIEARSRDFTPALEDIRAYHAKVTGEMFRDLAQGGDARGVHWEYFKDQYTRKTDGVTIHAWGGPRLRAGWSTREAKRVRTRRDPVTGQWIYAISGARLRYGVGQDIMTRRFVGAKSTGGEPNVRGKLRPSGRRVVQGDAIMQDIGAMRAEATQNSRITPRKLTITVGGEKAERQQGMRPFLFVTDEDADFAQGAVARYLAGGSGASVGAGGESMLAYLRELSR